MSFHLNFEHKACVHFYLFCCIDLFLVLCSPHPTQMLFNPLPICASPGPSEISILYFIFSFFPLILLFFLLLFVPVCFPAVLPA